MATNIGTLMATVGVDTRPLKKGLKDAEQQTKASTTKMLNHWKSMAVGIVATYALYKTANLVKETALLAARFETLDIVMKTVGKNAGYSAEQMDQYDLALRKTGISMIESRRTLAMMTQAQLDLSKATELGRIAQDAAVIGNINSSEAFQRMIYGIQTGNLVVLRRIGINVSFEKSYKAVAKATDRTVESFTESEKAMIRQNAVIQYGTRIAGTYEAAMGTAGKKLTSFVRYVEDFKVKMGKAFGPATVTLVDAATQAMKEFQIEISRPEAQEALRNLSSQLATTIVQLGKDLPNAVKMTTNKINTLVQLYNSLPEGVIGATGTGLIGRMMFGSWTAASFLGLLYLITEQIGKLGADKLSKLFSGMSLEEAKKWREELDLAALQDGTLKIKFDEQGINQFVKMQEMFSKGVPTRLDFALEDPSKYYGERDPGYEQTDKMKEIYAKYYEALEEMAENADMKAIMRERERLKELEPLIEARHEIWLSAYETEEARLDEYAAYRTGQEKSIAEQIRAIRMEDKAFALAALKEKYENYKNFTDDLIGLELWFVAEKKKLEEDKYSDMENAMIGWANNFSSTLNDMLWGAEVTFKSILESFMKMITQMMIQMAIIEPLVAGITGGGTLAGITSLFSAQGNVFSQSGLQNFAQGGIVNKPTHFAFASGVGLMGEAGPEAIMPLTRTSKGDLGVRTEGGNQEQTVNIIMNNPTFQDLETQRQVMIQIASVVASQVAPGAVVENYNNDGEIRRTVRGGI